MVESNNGHVYLTRERMAELEHELKDLRIHGRAVKVDVLALGCEAAAGQLERLRDFRVRIIAERIESQDMYDACRKLGFDGYQGYFFCRPQTLEQRSIPAADA